MADFQQSHWAIVIPTLSRSQEEAVLLGSSVEMLARHGSPIFAGDGGSHRELIRKLQSLVAGLHRFDRDKKPTLVRQIKEAMALAMKANPAAILYTEPDKKEFFEAGLAEFVNFARTCPDAGIVMASRDESSFATFPSAQRLPESLANQLLAETFGINADFLYGPLVLNIRLLSHLEDIPDDLGWGWRICLMAIAAKSGMRLIPYSGRFVCPIEQRAETGEKNRIYRLEQMAQNVRGLAIGMAYRL